MLHNDLLYHPSYLRRRRRLFSLGVLRSMARKSIWVLKVPSVPICVPVAVVFNNMDALGCARGIGRRGVHCILRSAHIYRLVLLLLCLSQDCL